jgi:thiosulfate dehydrogenase [quinone] large subunit
MKNYPRIYLMARLPIALSMFGHGLERMFKLDKFALGMASEFDKTVLPQAMVLPFGYTLPFLELLTGLLLLLGLFTRFALNLGWVLMLVLIFGSSFVEGWQNIFSQIVYALNFAALLLFIQYNTISLDARRSR